MTDATDDLQRAAEGLVESAGELLEAFHVLRLGRSREEALAALGTVFGLDASTVQALVGDDELPGERRRPRPRRRGARPHSLRGDAGRSGISNRGARKRRYAAASVSTFNVKEEELWR